MKQKRTLALLLTGVMTLSALAMTGCGGGTEETAEGGAAPANRLSFIPTRMTRLWKP